MPPGDIDGIWMMRLNFDDLWLDADLPEVIQYLYGSKHLLVKLPEPLKERLAAVL